MTPDTYEPPPHKQPAKGRSGCMIGCAVTIVLLVLGATFVIINFKKIAARVVAHMIEKTIEESDLDAAQKQKLIARIDLLRDDYIDGKITDEQLRRVAEEISEGPLILVGTVYHLNSEYVQPSTLSDEEKKAAMLTLQRVARGVHEGKIPWAKLDPMFRSISDTDADGKRELKKKLTNTELRDFLTLAEREAGKANIPHEPMQIDLAEELDKAIERAIKGEERPF